MTPHRTSHPCRNKLYVNVNDLMHALANENLMDEDKEE